MSELLDVRQASFVIQNQIREMERVTALAIELAQQMSSEDREQVRQGLVAVAEKIRKKYHADVAVLKYFLKEMLEVSI